MINDDDDEKDNHGNDSHNDNGGDNDTGLYALKRDRSHIFVNDNEQLVAECTLAIEMTLKHNFLNAMLNKSVDPLIPLYIRCIS